MTVNQLIQYLQENFSGDSEVLIDTSVDGGFSSNRELFEEDIQIVDDNNIIFTTSY